MATTKDYLQFILEQLRELDGITYRMMMGEYIIYYNGRIAAYICDDRLLVKPTESAKKYLENLDYQPPYEGAKPMLLVDNVDDKDYLCGLFNVLYDELPLPKPKKHKG